jgi:NADPH:quinone reductase-like Zn-dependent oxidoreductase
MKFIEAPQFGGPEVLTVVETETPTPEEGMLLVEVKAAGINYADIMARSGFYPQVPKAPFALGFEIAGVVTDVGKCVEGFKEGDSVAAITLAGGGYATHAVIPAATAIPLPTGFDHALAVALLITHGPPLGILDQTAPKEAHLGCAELLDVVKRKKPRVHIFGHIHGGAGTFENETTRFINAAYLNERYKPLLPAGKIHIVDI